MIYLQKINNTYLRVDAEDSLLMEIHELYSFYAPNYRFMPKYRNKMWDGKIRIMDLRNRRLPIGLLDHLLEHCEHRGYEVHLSPELLAEQPNNDHRAGVEAYIRSIKLPPGRDFRDYQIQAIVDALIRKRMIAVSATGSGKSLIIYGMILGILEANPNARIILSVPTINLTQQMKSDFIAYSKENGLPFEDWAQVMHGGKDKNIGPETRVVISTWQTLVGFGKNFYEQFDALICDEVHLFKSDVVKTIVERADVPIKIGTTGTLDDSVTNEMVLRGLFGTPEVYTTSAELMREGKLADLTIKAIILEHTPEEIPKISSYKEEVDYLKSSQKKMKFLAMLALATEGNTLVMFAHIDSHAKIFYEYIKKLNEKNGNRKKIFFFAGSVAPHERELIRNRVEEMDDAIIVGSQGVIATGTNIVNLSNLIYAASGKGKILNLQSIGRVLRRSETKTKATLFDVTDDLTKGKKKRNYTYEHFFIRYDRYMREDFNVELKKIRL